MLTLACSAFSYGLDPMYFEADISNENGYREIGIINTNKMEKGRYKIAINPGPDKDKDISKYIKIYPKVITVDPDSTGYVKVFADIKEELPRDEYNFSFRVTPVTIPTLKKQAEGVSGGISAPIAFEIPMYGHYGEATEVELKEKLITKDFSVYEKDGMVWVKGSVENNLHYGFVLSIQARSEGESRIKTQEIGRIPRSGGKLDFNFPLGDSFSKASQVYSLRVMDIINFKPMKEVVIGKK